MVKTSGYRHFSGCVTDWALKELVPFPAGATCVFLLYGSTPFLGPPRLLCNGHSVLFHWQQSSRYVKLTIHPRLVWGLRIREAIPAVTHIPSWRTQKQRTFAYTLMKDHIRGRWGQDNLTVYAWDCALECCSNHTICHCLWYSSTIIRLCKVNF